MGGGPRRLLSNSAEMDGMTTRETWYVLEDGSVADPRFIGTGNDGALRHEDGRKVAYGPHGPRSRSVDASEVAAASPDAKEVKPEKPNKGYKTRESTAKG